MLILDHWGSTSYVNFMNCSLGNARGGKLPVTDCSLVNKSFAFDTYKFVATVH